MNIRDISEGISFTVIATLLHNFNVGCLHVLKRMFMVNLSPPPTHTFLNFSSSNYFHQKMSKVTKLFSCFPGATERPLKGDRTLGYFKPRREGVKIQAKEVTEKVFSQQNVLRGKFPISSSHEIFSSTEILSSSYPSLPSSSAQEKRRNEEVSRKGELSVPEGGGRHKK